MNKLILILLTTISISFATDYFDTCTAGIIGGVKIPDTVVIMSYENNSGNAIYSFGQRIEINITGNERTLKTTEYIDSATAIESKTTIKLVQNDYCDNCKKITKVLNKINQTNFFSLKCVSDYDGALSRTWGYMIYCKFGTNIHSIRIIDDDNSIKQKGYLIIKEIFNNIHLFKYSTIELSKKYPQH